MVELGAVELTDKAWAQTQPLLPSGGRPGDRWPDQPAQAVAWHRHRFDKRAVNYRAGVVIVSLLLWLARAVGQA